MNVYAIRGAITVDCDTEKEIREKTVLLMREIMERNSAVSSYVSVVFSLTDDITAFYPAQALRESGLLDVPLFSCAEPKIKGSLPLCIRVLVTVTSENELAVRHVYLGKAKDLRKDLN